MAKVIDITDKLNFEEKPKIKIKGKEIELNNKAVDMLRITPTLQKKNVTIEDFDLLYQVLFPPESQEVLESFELAFEDFATVIWEAAQLVAGGNDQGEAQTPTTT